MLPFYFVASETGRTLDQVRGMPAAEFFSWLNFHGFPSMLDRCR
jgi:hypothetical protein